MKILATIIIGVGAFLGWFFYTKPEPPFVGAVTTAELDNKTVSFVYEDGKDNENLTLKLEASSYGNNMPIYFSIQNLTALDQTVAVVFTFKDNRTEVYDIKEFVSNTTITTVASNSQPGTTKTVTNWDDKVQITPNKTLLENIIKLIPGIKDKITVGSYYSGFASSIPAGATKYYKFRINATSLYTWIRSKNNVQVSETSQEFFIEVFGANSYGHIQ